MAEQIKEMSEDVELVSKLSDQPNHSDGLTAEELKAVFDKGPALLKEFINKTLVPALNTLISNGQVVCVGISQDETGAYVADMAFAEVLQKHDAGFVVLCKIAVDSVEHYLPINWARAGALSFAGPVGHAHFMVEYDAAGQIQVLLQPLATQAGLETLLGMAQGTQEDVAALQSDVDKIKADLAYVPIDITAISCPQAKTYELGQVITSLTISWSLNKAPATQVLGGESLSVVARSKELTGLSISAAKTYTLAVTDERGATDSASVSLAFCNGVYYGVLADGATIDNAAILALTRELRSVKGITFTANAGAAQRIAFALPARYGTPVFTVGGFEGGFSKAATIEFTNASGYTESYDVWLSENVNLGSTTVKVS